MRVKDIGNTGPVEIPYSDTTVRKVYGSGFNDFFVNTDPAVCPIQQCRLLNAGGKTYKNNGDNQIVQIGSARPWDITYAQNTNSFNEEFCVECDNGFYKVQQCGLKISQTSKCINSLRVKQDPLKRVGIDLDRDAKPLIVSQGW